MNEDLCPLDCPNRKSESSKIIAKIGAYSFALVLGLFLVSQCFTWTYKRTSTGEELAINSKTEPPVGLLVPGLFLMGLALGINIDPNVLLGLVVKK